MRSLFVAISVAVAVVAPCLGAQQTLQPEPEGYRLPPPEIVRVVDAPPLPAVSLDPRRTTMMLIDRAALPPIADLARPMWRLAGRRVDPSSNGSHGARSFVGMRLTPISGGEELIVALPEDADLGMPSWSPDGSRFAFTLTTPTAIHLWVGESATGKVRRLSAARLNAAGGAPFRWMPDGRHLLCRFVPTDRGPVPEPPRVPAGPVIKEASGRKAPVRTYQDLLRNPYDEARFDWVMCAQLALVDAVDGARRDIGKPAIFSQASAAPSGNLLLIGRTVRPYSYLVTAGSFPEVIEVWNLDGKVVAEIAKRPLRDAVPIGGVPTGPRRFTWHPEALSNLIWVEALDGGDPKKEVPFRDRVMMRRLPSFETAEEIARTEHRFRFLQWVAGGRHALLSEFDRDRRWTRGWLWQGIGTELRPVWDRSVNDRYADPGRPVTTTTATGRSVIRLDEGVIYLAGNGASPEGARPFLDRLDLESLKTERLWRCAGECYESVVDVLGGGASRILIRHETPKSPPNYLLVDLERGTRRPLTHFEDPAPELRAAKKKLITYDRGDGVTLSATLYLPPDYREGERRPLLVWAYPLEYGSRRTAGQVSRSPYRYTPIRGASHLLLLTQGYVIMDGAAMPVIGDAETVNDAFVDQIRVGAQAAIDEAARLGVADPERVGVGGHSYGAFMTANLLAHTDLFRAGCARSGAYNRSLTPFGFQSERRTLWEALDTYVAVSPFMHANEIDEPLLLIHGQIDSNSGTFPIQSERLYHAVKGNGGTVRLVMLPHESHGYRARESVLHTLAEMVDWFDRHVKQAKPRGVIR